MDEAGDHLPKQINAGTENPILHVLTYKWNLNFRYLWKQRQHKRHCSLEGEEREGARVEKLTIEYYAQYLGEGINHT